MLFSLATAARFMRHATTVRAAFGTPTPKPIEEIARRYEKAADYLHRRFKRKNHDRRDD